MAQLSVPSSDLESVVHESINTHPGASSNFTALAEDDTVSYIDLNMGTGIGGLNAHPFSYISVGMQSIVDPGVDTGFTLRYIAKLDKGTLANAPTANLTLNIFFGGSFAPVYQSPNLWNFLTTSFALYEIVLDEFQVQHIRGNGGWNNLWVQVFNQTQNNTAELPKSHLQIAFVQLEAPNAGPPADIESTGGPELEITDESSGGNSNIIFITPILAGPTLGVKLGKLLAFNTTTGGPRLGITGESFWPHSEFIGGPNLELNGNARKVLTIDVSGLYTFIENKRNDTFYTGTLKPGETVDVKIPRPFGKTSLLGG